jgi:hypothetical protein
MSGRLILVVAGLLLWGPASAQSAVADLAPGQLRYAERSLLQAREALAQRDHERARRFAAQAGLDARLAYRMSDSAFLRREAVEIHEASARLRWLTVQQDLSALR